MKGRKRWKKTHPTTTNPKKASVAMLLSGKINEKEGLTPHAKGTVHQEDILG